MTLLLLLATTLLAGNAHAACQLAQTPTATGTRLDLLAVAEPLSCRRVTLRSPGAPPVVTVTRGKHRVRKDHVLTSAGQVEIGLPELMPGDSATIEIAVPGDKLEVYLGSPPPVVVAAREVHVTWNVVLDPKHPGWGFADPTLATTHREVATVDPDGLLRVDMRGAPAQGVLPLSPGSFTLNIPGAHLFGGGPEGVTVTHIPTGLRFDAPQGGEARWRVDSAGGARVIPDGRTYVEGLDWRFSQVSLPEPAVPMRYATVSDPLELAQGLYAEVQALVDGWLPGPDALHPRQLNRAWRSGWATPVERALILDRMLKQQRIVSAWALTGENPEPLTLTGYDHMLIAAQLGEREVLLDPACAACAFDEVSTRFAGKPGIGSAPIIPLAPGTLERGLKLNGTEFAISVTATGAGALWLRELTWGLTETRRNDVLATALGVEGGHVVSAAGLTEPGAGVHIELTSSHSPKPVFVTDPPWIGGWTDL